MFVSTSLRSLSRGLTLASSIRMWCISFCSVLKGSSPFALYLNSFLFLLWFISSSYFFVLALLSSLVFFLSLFITVLFCCPSYFILYTLRCTAPFTLSLLEFVVWEAFRPSMIVVFPPCGSPLHQAMAHFTHSILLHYCTTLYCALPPPFSNPAWHGSSYHATLQCICHTRHCGIMQKILINSWLYQSGSRHMAKNRGTSCHISLINTPVQYSLSSPLTSITLHWQYATVYRLYFTDSSHSRRGSRLIHSILFLFSITILVSLPMSRFPKSTNREMTTVLRYWSMYVKLFQFLHQHFEPERK